MKVIDELIPLELKDYIVNQIVPQYTHFDKAHQVDHVLKVISESMALANHYAVDCNMVYVIAAFHDLGLSRGREFHHIESGNILLQDMFLKKWFTQQQLHVMRDAIEDHRASNKHEPRTIYGKIVAEADRIINPIVTLRRTVQYGLSHYPQLDKEGQYERFCEHLMVKYAPGGYLKLWIPESSNAARLEELRQLIADKKELHRTFCQLYNEELLS